MEDVWGIDPVGGIDIDIEFNRQKPSRMPNLTPDRKSVV